MRCSTPTRTAKVSKEEFEQRDKDRFCHARPQLGWRDLHLDYMSPGHALSARAERAQESAQGRRRTAAVVKERAAFPLDRPARPQRPAVLLASTRNGDGERSMPTDFRGCGLPSVSIFATKRYPQAIRLQLADATVSKMSSSASPRSAS
jgi:hypothetical protein